MPDGSASSAFTPYRRQTLRISALAVGCKAPYSGDSFVGDKHHMEIRFNAVIPTANFRYFLKAEESAEGDTPLALRRSIDKGMAPNNAGLHVNYLEIYVRHRRIDARCRPKPNSCLHLSVLMSFRNEGALALRSGVGLCGSQSETAKNVSS